MPIAHLHKLTVSQNYCLSIYFCYIYMFFVNENFALFIFIEFTESIYIIYNTLMKDTWGTRKPISRLVKALTTETSDKIIT